ncbi:MAG: hypothetical protein HY761_09175 [Candidatus Omnitrophica bacterium]|nr:hypothetical protein [Candidatus Omnitrophota bacterium]
MTRAVASEVPASTSLDKSSKTTAAKQCIFREGAFLFILGTRQEIRNVPNYFIMNAKINIKLLITAFICCLVVLYFLNSYRQKQVLLKIIERLSADSRAAEVLVTDVRFDPQLQKTYTTIKFLEYDTKLNPLPAKYFTFSGNIIQFQSMVIRFDDLYVKRGDSLRGKSAYIFMKAFVLSDHSVEVFEINKANSIPSGYKIEGPVSRFENKFWEKFWQYALEPKEASKLGIKNAQIEAPGTKFIPGMLYTIKIEHDGGLRIDAQPLPKILKGETIKVLQYQ